MPRITPSDIAAAIRIATGSSERLGLHEPLFSGNEENYVRECVQTGWVSSVGSFVDRFERDLASACGAAYAVAIVNGTCALQVALHSLGMQAYDEVLIPSLTFVATANAVVHAGGVPHFVEVEEVSLGIDPEALKKYLADILILQNGQPINRHTGRVVRALMPVHVFGHPCQLAALREIAAHYGLAFLEDATEALGSRIDDAPVGSDGIAVLSFNGNKIITTGGGGAILVQSEAEYARLKHLTTTAKQPHAWAFMHDEVAWNYRLPNLNAALGCAQLEQLSSFVASKRALAARYMNVLDNVVQEPPGTTSNYWLCTLRLNTASMGELQEILTHLHAENILCRPVWTPLHQLPMFAHAPRANLALTEALAHQLLNLPSSVKLGLPYVG